MPDSSGGGCGKNSALGQHGLSDKHSQLLTRMLTVLQGLGKAVSGSQVEWKLLGCWLLPQSHKVMSQVLAGRCTEACWLLVLESKPTVDVLLI